ncbi:MAG: toxin-antitoxin system TumE family protein [Candidatus Kariarchaeaceae archaeon]
MSSFDKLKVSYDYFQVSLSHEIQFITLDEILDRIKIGLNDGIFVYVRYNDFLEYSYQIIFSTSKYDRIRFDNYDDKWQVDTRPHHFHPRYSKKGFKSPMSGKPTEDIPLVIGLIKNNNLRDKNYRFLKKIFPVCYIQIN